MHAQHFLSTEREQSIYDSCRFDIGRFRAEPTNYERGVRPSDTFAYRSAHNNLLGTQREHLGKRPIKKQGMNKVFLNPFYIFWEIAGNNLSVPHS